MAEKVKSPVILLIGLIIISLCLAGGVFLGLQKEKAKNLALQAELEDVKTKQKAAEAKLEESQRLVANLESRVEEARRQVDSLSEELQAERVAKQEVLAQIGEVKAQLEEQRDLRDELEKKFTQAQQGIEKLQAELQELQAKKDELETKLKGLEEAKQAKDVELGKIVVSPEAGQAQGAAVAPGAKPVSVEGKVLVINKEYNFLVINLGKKDGIVVGDEFAVYHENRYIGDAKAEKVHDSMSALGFLTTDLKGKISEGDIVVRKGK
jgi:peptidoglycan hydrolase CwlO-like protein